MRFLLNGVFAVCLLLTACTTKSDDNQAPATSSVSAEMSSEGSSTASPSIPNCPTPSDIQMVQEDGVVTLTVTYAEFKGYMMKDTEEHLIYVEGPVKVKAYADQVYGSAVEGEPIEADVVLVRPDNSRHACRFVLSATGVK